MFTVLGGLFLGLVCLDMGIKCYIENTYEEREERETILDGVVFRKIYNRGFVLNTLENKPKLIKGVSAVSGVGVLAYDVWLFLKKGKLFQKIGMIFMSAGAVSNIYDRLVRGKVIDYIGFQSKFRFVRRLTANLADFYVTIGAVIMSLTKR